MPDDVRAVERDALVLRVRLIDTAPAELDVMAGDAGLLPATIKRRCEAIHHDVAAAPTPPPAGPYTYQRNLDAERDRAVVDKAIRRALRR